MLLMHPGLVKVAQFYYSAKQARESGGMLPQESISTTTFSFNCFIKYKNFSQKVMIEVLVLCTGWSDCIDTAL